ncbi:MAG: hypothetical protein ACFB14_03350, partial [Leptolyngbyaceae cyanobacterium]
RSVDGARMFCRIRGYFSTLRKYDQPILATLIRVFSGQSVALTPQPEYLRAFIIIIKFDSCSTG